MRGTVAVVLAILAAAAIPGSARATQPLTIGVTTRALATNSTWPWRPSAFSQVSAFEHLVHTQAGIVMWYADWRHGRVDPVQLRTVARHGGVPEITWEPWDATGGVTQPAYSLASIIRGRHDAYIRGWARTLRAYGKPVLVRFAQEMNGRWYPWDEGVNGNRPGQFAAAWRHVVRIFRRAGARNVTWIWSPVARGGFPLSTREYPGAAYVEEVGLSGFNAGTALPPGWGGWRTFAHIFGPSLATLARLAPGKPVQISEVSTVSVGGNATAWITSMFRFLAAHRAIRSVIWFDLQKQTDWRITSPSMGRAFAAGVRLARRAR